MTSRTVIVALVACLVGSSVAMADELAVGFSEADLNDDGSLDVDEYLAAVIKTFATRDSNGNRLLTASELPEASPQGFSRIDRNGDATISVGEAAGDRIVRFFDADANHNGLLTLTELRRYIDTLDTETTR
jgi:Ca2+-binding EF-hand superfamily protein